MTIKSKIIMNQTLENKNINLLIAKYIIATRKNYVISYGIKILIHSRVLMQ